MDQVTKSLVYCLEIYKAARHLTGAETVRLFEACGVFEYLVSCYEALHTTGPQYIIEDIAGLIEEGAARAGKPAGAT